MPESLNVSDLFYHIGALYVENAELAAQNRRLRESVEANFAAQKAPVEEPVAEKPKRTRKVKG